MDNQLIPFNPNETSIVLYETPNGEVKLDVRMQNETVWLNLNQMAMLFDRDKSVISRHLRDIFKSGELDEKEVVAFFATTSQHGSVKGLTQTHNVKYYNLDMIISLGYRVNSKRGVEFRRWSSKVLKAYILRGYAINDHIRREQIAELRQLVQVVVNLINQQNQ